MIQCIENIVHTSILLTRVSLEDLEIIDGFDMNEELVSKMADELRSNKEFMDYISNLEAD